MSFHAADLWHTLPELWLLGMAAAILLLDLFVLRHRGEIAYGLAQATLIGALALIGVSAAEGPARVLSDSYVNDALATLLKVAVCVLSLGVFIYARDYLRERGLLKAEFYVLGLFSVLGMMVMISAASLLTLYLGLELSSLSLYALVALDRDSGRASEAAMKYFVLGALASGMLLYGMSLLYGSTGSLSLDAIAAAIGTGLVDHPPLLLGLAFVVVGLAFKLSAAPFHMWAPDVYHGAPTAVTGFIATAPKVAAVAIMLRLLGEGLADLHGTWRDMLVLLTVLSLVIGNIVAIAQTNIKRMLAYSTISHAGFLLIGILAGNAQGYAAALFYVVTYAAMALGAFGVIILLSRNGFEAERLDDFKGLNERSPWFAFVMLLLMFSMTGVPPTVGFYAKLAVLKAAVETDAVWLAVVAVMFSLVGAFYYLRMIKLMYFDKPEDSTPIRAAWDMSTVLSANGIAVLAFGLFPGGLMAWCLAAL